MSGAGGSHGVGGWCGGWWLVAAAGLVRLWWVRAGLGWDFLRALRGQNSLAGKNVSTKSCTLYPIPFYHKAGCKGGLYGRRNASCFYFRCVAANVACACHGSVHGFVHPAANCCRCKQRALACIAVAKQCFSCTNVQV